MNDLPEYQITWKQVFGTNLKYFYLFTLICLVVFQHINIQMLLYFQHRRESIAMFDPILRMIPPHPMNTGLNIVCYGALGIVLIYFSNKPKQLFIVLHALLLMWMLRWATMYLLPLAAPPDKVPLDDVIAYSHHLISRDLFFSGHTATLLIMLFAVKNRWMFLFTLVMTLTIVVLLLIGHQHYFLDIVSAPFFAYCCYQLSNRINQLLLPNFIREKSSLLAG